MRDAENVEVKNFNAKAQGRKDAERRDELANQRIDESTNQRISELAFKGPEVGLIPAEWKVAKLGRLCKLNQDSVDPREIPETP